ncbi:MAG: hypothetical protein ACE5HJ_03835 [Thermoplasmata archaeon]
MPLMIPRPIPPEARSDIESAKTLALIAIIFQAITLVIGLVFLMLLVIFLLTLFAPPPVQAYAVNASTTFEVQQVSMVMPLFLPMAFFTGFGILPLIFLLLTYFLVYKRLSEGRVEETLMPALVIGVFSLFLGGLIPGILLIIAYVKAKDGHNKILYAQGSATGP